RLHARDANAVRGHLWADHDYQRRSVRFLENHDEPRAASAFEDVGVHKAAAVIKALTPGLRFFHEGQFEGRKVHLSVHLRRRPDEPVNADLRDFYHQLLEVLRRPEVRHGQWRQLECRPPWEGNPTWERYLAFWWESPEGRLLIAVNYGPTRGQCYVNLPIADLRGNHFVFRDLMGSAAYERDGNDLASRGLYLDMPEWAYHVFEVNGP